MEQYLKVGQEFEVVKVVHSIYERALKKGDITVGTKSLFDGYYRVLTTCSLPEFKDGFSWRLREDCAKPIGKLTITKVK